MSYSIHPTLKSQGKNKGPRWVVKEDGTPNMAIHITESGAKNSLKALMENKARFCVCSNFIIGMKSRTAHHFCSFQNRMVDSDGE